MATCSRSCRVVHDSGKGNGKPIPDDEEPLVDIRLTVTASTSPLASLPVISKCSTMSEVEFAAGLTKELKQQIRAVLAIIVRLLVIHVYSLH